MTHVWWVQSKYDFLLSFAISDWKQSTPEEPPEPPSFIIDLIQLEDPTDQNSQNCPMSLSIDLLPLAELADPPQPDGEPQSLFLELHEHMTPISKEIL